MHQLSNLANIDTSEFGVRKGNPTYPLVMTNIAMENGPFIDDFPS